MGEARSSGRLRKRPRISYAQPDDEELLSVAATADEKRRSDDEESDTDTSSESDEQSSSSDEEFVPNDRKKRKTNRTATKTKEKKTATPKRINKRKVFRWAALPGELRNMIYSICFSREDGIVFSSTRDHGKRTIGQYTTCGLNANLLLLNKATYVEGGPVLYRNELIFKGPLAMYTFFATLSPTPKAWVQNVTVNEKGSNGYFGSYGTDAGCFHPAFTSLIGTTNLRRLKMVIELRPHITALEVASRIYREAHFWLDAVGREKADKKAGAELIHVEGVPPRARWHWSTDQEVSVIADNELRSRLEDLLE
ncbi:hypothetical protein UCRNP2_3685 [Neofusicoccum parvum UCRNP2]|uniref:Uncharacterized protein n=1 Tax=Botryosphaeria parva (strain UCR-NP2) TaxID=1287680 RepID=R1GMN2_BOTPV|nr:hypothetical protein UCRNP2_3685 [Neofusicoccum parvum UCRNP2]